MSGTQIWTGLRNASRVIQQHCGLESPAEQEDADGTRVMRHTAVMGANETRSTDRTANIVLLDPSKSTASPIGHGDARPKLAGIKEACTMFLSRLPASAMLGVISFPTEASVLWPMQPLGSGKLQVIQQVQSLISSGQTALTHALRLALKQFQAASGDHIFRCYILTDGMATDGDPVPVAKKLKNMGVQVHSIGFGEGKHIDERAMRRMASTSAEGQRMYYHFCDAQKLTCFMRRQSSTVTL